MFSRHLLRQLESDGAEAAGAVTQNIVFLGDSVNSQLAQFLICDLLWQGRNAGSTAPSSASAAATVSSTVELEAVLGRGGGGGTSSDLAVRGFNRSVATFRVRLPTSSGSHEPGGAWNSILRVHNQQFNLPCIQNNRSGKCSLPMEKAVFDHVSALLDHYTRPLAPREHTAIVFNYGLHIHLKYAWTVRPMLAALWTRARELPPEEVAFYFRETSSQSFTGSPGEPPASTGLAVGAHRHCS